MEEDGQAIQGAAEQVPAFPGAGVPPWPCRQAESPCVFTVCVPNFGAGLEDADDDQRAHTEEPVHLGDVHLVRQHAGIQHTCWLDDPGIQSQWPVPATS